MGRPESFLNGTDTCDNFKLVKRRRSFPKGADAGSKIRIQLVTGSSALISSAFQETDSGSVGRPTCHLLLVAVCLHHAHVEKVHY